MVAQFNFYARLCSHYVSLTTRKPARFFVNRKASKKIKNESLEHASFTMLMHMKFISTLHTDCRTEHMSVQRSVSGGGKWAERPENRMSANLKKIRWSGSGRSRERERSGELAKSAAHSPLKPNN